MNIDFVKFLVKYAKGFTFKGSKDIPKVTYNSGNKYTCWADCIKDWDFYPLLLQKAIEGWNKSHRTITHFIDQNKEYIELNCDQIDPPLFWYNQFITIDEAKEAALKWIYEQETK